MRLLLIGSFLWFAAVSLLSANTDERMWTLQTGETFRAELAGFDEAAGKVTLKFNNAQEQVYEVALFSVIDRAWLTEWLELEESFDAKLKTLGGRVEHRLTQGTYPTDLFIYYPSSSKKTSVLPCLILFHPTAKAARYLKRHFEAAERAGMIIVSCGTFRNEAKEGESDLNLLRFREMLPQILALKQIDPAKVFLGGTSGGALRAFRYTVQVPYAWAGVYSNGGWLGGEKEYGLPYPSGMRVAIVNGNQDVAANHYVAPDSAVLNRTGSVVGVIVFEGAHQEPPMHSQLQAFNWLLQKEDAPPEGSGAKGNADAEPIREYYPSSPPHKQPPSFSAPGLGS